MSGKGYIQVEVNAKNRTNQGPGWVVDTYRSQGGLQTRTLDAGDPRYWVNESGALIVRVDDTHHIYPSGQWSHLSQKFIETEEGSE